MKRVGVFSPGSIGNVGPGFDVLGLAVDGIGDRFFAERAEDFSIHITGRDAQLIPTDWTENTVSLAAQEFCRLRGRDVKFSLRIERMLPASGGLGASAASSVAGAMIAAKFLGYEDDQENILRASLHAETQVAGRHLDNIAPCVLGGLTIVESVTPLRIYQAPIKGNYQIIVVTPPIKIKTLDSRKVLPPHLDQKEWVAELAKVATLLSGFASRDSGMISVGLQNCYGERYRKKLIPNFDKVQSLFMDQGCLAFSISGAGPSCFGLFDKEPDVTILQKHCEHLFGKGTTLHKGGVDLKGAFYL